jgi:FkbM family methyltransferase
MMIEFKDIIKKFNLQIKGVVHVGAHEGCETVNYVEQKIEKVILIEANPYRFKNLKKSIETGRYCTWCCPLTYSFFDKVQAEILKKYIVYNYAISDKKEGLLKFNLSNYDGGVDSLFKINQFGVESSWINYEHVDQVEVQTTTLDNLIKNKNEYNFLNIDVEGAELLVLKGSVDLLSNIDYIMLESQDVQRFDGSCLKTEVIEFLKKFNFNLVEYFDTGKQWGDCFFIKNEK